MLCGLNVGSLGAADARRIICWGEEAMEGRGEREDGRKEVRWLGAPEICSLNVRFRYSTPTGHARNLLVLHSSDASISRLLPRERS